MYPFIYIFGKQFTTYAIISILGLVVATFVFYLLTRKYKYYFEDVVFLALIAGAGIMVGGHILFGITNIPKLIDLFKNHFNLTDKLFWQSLVNLFGGLVYYGGFIGSVLLLYWFTGLKHMKKTVNRHVVLNIYGIVVPLFHAFGRVGCFFGGCCYGMECSWGFIVHGNTITPEINDVRRLPIQLIEAGINLLIFLLLLYFYKKDILKGRLLYAYMVIYPLCRFVLEFFRGDRIRGIWFGLSTSQWISIGMLIFAITSLIVKSKKAPVFDDSDTQW